jgi:phosphopantothenoylcysteine decarboxylase/phosphopantothenate--cysteine ligase
MTPSDLAVQELTPVLRGRHVLLCVGGGIAAYKACELARLLVRSGATVDVAMTDAAQQFVSPLTFQALTQRPVATTMLDPSEEQQIGHIGLADRAELAIVAPATADLCARIRYGLCNDIVTTALLATRVPVLLAPAMNVHMWNHVATCENMAALQARGYLQVGPGSGEMACGHVGDGRLAEPWDIARAAARVLAPKDLVGRRILITAGPTREHIDPVRFLSNPSSGKMGYAIANAALARGADVTLISGPVSIEPPRNAGFISVTSAAEMANAVAENASGAHAIVMSAAVSDYRPVIVHEQKVKKAPGPETLTFERTQDILATLGERFAGVPGRPVIVGFAAETERVIENAREKLLRKKADFIVANYVGSGGAFGSADNEVTLVSEHGEQVIARASKDEVARQIVDEISRRLGEVRT